MAQASEKEHLEVENHHWIALDTKCKTDLEIKPFELDALVDHLSKSGRDKFLLFLKSPKTEWKLLKNDSKFLKLIKYYKEHENEMY